MAETVGAAAVILSFGLITVENADIAWKSRHFIADNDKITASAPTVSAILPALIEYIDKDDLLAHNMPIVLKFLYKYGFDYRDNHKNRRLFDTQKMAEHKLLEVMDNFDLHTVCVYYGIFSNKISTLSDCLATAKIYAALLEEYGVE